MLKKHYIKILLLILVISTLLTLHIFFYQDFLAFSCRLKGYKSLETKHFTILHLPSNKNDAKLVAASAEKAYDIVGKDFDFYPKDKIFVIIYKDSKSLQRVFDFPEDENLQGVYHRGIIHVQSPEGWLLAENEDFDEAFFRKGPMIHEYTHLVVDYMTSGNYTRWFTEGVAQLVEERVTGYTLREDFTISEDYYNIDDILYNFDELEDVPKAYIQALDMIKTLTKGDMEEITKICSCLRQGISANDIFLYQELDKGNLPEFAEYTS